MAEHTQEPGQPERSASLKDEIIQKIHERRDAEMHADAGTAPTAAAAVRRGRGWRTGNVRDMAIYARQLATLVDVGVPLLRALQILGERSTNKRLRAVSADLARRLEEGQSLSTAMTAHPGFFSPMFVGVVRAGEAGGILDDSLRRLADLLERRADMRRRIRGALMYPTVALIVEIIVIGIVVLYALPKLASVYPNPEDLPAVTRGVLGMSTWVMANWLLLLILVIAIIIFLVFLLRTVAGRSALHRTTLRMPPFAGLSRKINVARFARTTGNLTAAGIPLIDALAIAAETADNVVVERTLYRVRETVEHGGKMEEPMRSEPIFDPVVVDMVMVGDEAGALDTMLLKIADTYDAEVDSSLRTVTSLIEPALIVLLGIAVGFIAVSVFLPYLNLVNNPRLMPE